MFTVHRLAARLIVVLVAAVFASACTPTSQFPIPASDGEIDARLSGTWFGTLAESESTIHFFEAESKRLPALIVARDEDDPTVNDGWMLISSVVSKIKKHRFLSAEIIMEGGEEPDPDFEGYHLLRYRFDDQGTLLVDMLDTDAIAAVIQAGDLSGTVDEGRYFDTVRITATSDELKRYMRSAPIDTLFAVRLATLKKQ